MDPDEGTPLTPEQHDNYRRQPEDGADDGAAGGAAHRGPNLDDSARWELLLEAVVSIASGLSVDGLLARIVAVAGRLSGAQYAALGVLDPGSVRRLRTFVVHGMTDQVAAEIGDLPSGHGLLGLIIDRPEPLRLQDMGAHPASHGFPPNHPPMRSFLGVPVRARSRVFGNLYLTEKLGGGDFTEEDERIVVALAAAAGVVIENAELFEEARRRERWLQATMDLTQQLMEVSPEEEVGQMVTDQALRAAEADLTWLVAGTTADDVRIRALSTTGPDRADLGQVVLELSVEAMRSGQPAVVAELDLVGEPALGPVVMVPLGEASELRGVLGMAWAHAHADRQRDLDPLLPAAFMEQASLGRQVRRLHRDSERLAVFEDRDRIGRDLHDLVIQRLFAVGLSLQGAARQEGGSALGQRLEAAVDDLDATIRDIRTTIFKLGHSHGGGNVQGEVSRLVDRAAATLKFRPTLTFEGPVGSHVGADVAPDLLAVLTEALSNAARHAQASRIDVRVRAGDEVVVEVIDDGGGIPVGVNESGLRNMRERAQRRGGILEVKPGPAGGTHVRWSIPARSTPGASGL